MFLPMFDPLYFIILAPGLLLAAWAQYRVASAFREGSQYRSRGGISGAQAAAQVMEAEGVHGVSIEPVPGELTDHYDPSHKVLRLSEPVYGGRSLASLGVAAHEAGHAIQDAHRYSPLVVRNLMVPVASNASSITFAPGGSSLARRERRSTMRWSSRSSSAPTQPPFMKKDLRAQAAGDDGLSSSGPTKMPTPPRPLP